ncbi:MAG TPA: phage holin family protein [Candidatus Eisenbacteria bacterium]|nr:phage holin family protein [Candidatus Eisenbacteria bacterium]
MTSHRGTGPRRPTRSLAEVRAAIRARGRRLEETFPGRCLRAFFDFEGIDRALVLAAQAFTALIPLLILVSTLAPSGSRGRIASALTGQAGLQGRAAESVSALFSRPAGTTASLSVVSFVLVFVSGTSFTRRMQRMYQQAWGQPPLGVRGSIHAALGLAALLLEIVLLSALRTLVKALPLDRVLLLPFSLAAGLVLWTSIPWLLLDRRVHWRRLLPAGALAAAATSLYGIATSVYMPRLIERYSARYGLFGVTIAMLGWLLCIAAVLVAATVVGVELDRAPDPWARRLRARLGIVEPPPGAVAAAPAGASVAAAPPVAAESTSPAGGEAQRATAADISRMLRRILIEWLVLAVAIAIAAAVVPGVDVKGGFLTLLWVAAIFGLVNALLGPILHLVSLPLTVLTLGLFALVVNGVLLAITAGLTDNLDVGGFGWTMVAALIISVVSSVLYFLVRPARRA